MSVLNQTSHYKALWVWSDSPLSCTELYNLHFTIAPDAKNSTQKNLPIIFMAKTHLQGRWPAMVRHMQGCNEQFAKTHFGKEQNVLHLKFTLRTVTFVNAGQGNFSWASAPGPTALRTRVSLNVPGKLHQISKEIIPPCAVCYGKKAICLFWISCTEGPLLSQENLWSEL